MGWNGYFAFAGTEVINAERTEAYAAAAKAPWFTPIFKSTAVSTLEDADYINPWVDNPPWGDPDYPDTYRFWGAYPLNVTGIEDGTWSAQITENLGDGGHIGPLRAATRSVVFEVLLLGEDECAVEAGMGWLKSTLTGSPCLDGGGCNGDELCYFTCEPCIPEGCGETAAERMACAAENMRTLRNVKITSSPSITAKRTTTDGAAVWAVTFTATAGIPWEFGNEVPLVEGFMVAADPWIPEIIPADWRQDAVGEVISDAACAVKVYDPIVDPLCIAVEPPPSVPLVSLKCFTAPEEWERRWFSIPRKYVPYWGDVVPVVRVQARRSEVRNLRLRFYSDVDGDGDISQDPCAYCGDILFSYIPPNHTLVFDGVSQTVSAEGPGGVVRRADSLVFKTDGTPFDWPLLTCGFGYVVAVDLPSDHVGVVPGVDLSVTPRRTA